MLTLPKLMIFYAALVSSGTTNLPACLATDLQCFKLQAADLVLQRQDLQQQLESTRQQLTLANVTATKALDAATLANNYAQSIAKDAQGHWYERPIVWFALGFLVASAACIGIAAAINHVTR